MMTNRIHNFNAGPSALPLPVLEEIQAEMLDFKSSGMSILEISHRSPPFDEVINETAARVKRLLSLSDDFEVLFIQGGASLQFAMAPMNLCAGMRPAFINTGTWSTKAIAEAKIQGHDPLVVASSEEADFTYIPKDFTVPEGAAYLHFTTNNTIKGTQFHTFPQADCPLVADMSSDIMSRPFDAKPFGLVYAGAQKNLGPAGVCLVIIRKDMLQRTPSTAPTMLRYTTHAEKNSMFNTPACFAIYAVGLMLKWLEETIGGLDKVAAMNQAKAKTLYDCFDSSEGFFRATAKKDSRSLMNVTFRIKDEGLEAGFVAEALQNGLGGLKGHKSVGGCRASLYNAVSQESVDALVSFMNDFAKRNG